jgi:hypothetical protein
MVSSPRVQYRYKCIFFSLQMYIWLLRIRRQCEVELHPADITFSLPPYFITFCFYNLTFFLLVILLSFLNASSFSKRWFY